MDKGNILRVFLPLVAGLCALYFVFMKGPGPRDSLRWLGLILSLVALGVVVLARYTLGRSFSIRPKATALVNNGIYARIRNPIYIASAILIVGVVLIVRRPELLLLLLIIIPMQIIRARREAQVLEAKFGDAYRQYRSRTWF